MSDGGVHRRLLRQGECHWRFPERSRLARGRLPSSRFVRYESELPLPILKGSYASVKGGAAVNLRTKIRGFPSPVLTVRGRGPPAPIYRSQGRGARSLPPACGREISRRIPKAKPRNKKVDSGNANTTIGRHCEEPLRRSNPGAACCGPWIVSIRSPRRWGWHSNFWASPYTTFVGCGLW